MKTTAMVLCGSVIGLLALGVRAADPTGQWQAEFETQIGVQKYLFEFKAQGDQATAKATAEANDQTREVEFKEVKLTGDTLTFVEMRTIRDNEIRIEYTGKVSDQGIAFTRKVGAGELGLRAPEGGIVEVDALASAMNRMVGEIERSRDDLAHKERLEKEMEIAKRIQTSILPRTTCCASA